MLSEKVNCNMSSVGSGIIILEDIIGEVEEIGPLDTKDTRIKENTPFREVTIRDQSGSTSIVLWGDKARQPLKKKDVVTVSPVKLGLYKGGLSVESTYKSLVQVNPNIPEADKFKERIDLPIDVTSEDEDTDIEMRGSQSINEESEESLTGPSNTNRGSKARKRISFTCKTSSESSDSEAEMSPPRGKRLQNEKNQKKINDYGRIRKKSSEDGTFKLKYGEDSQLEGKEESPRKKLRKTGQITASTQTKIGGTVGQTTTSKAKPSFCTPLLYTSIMKTQRAIEGHTEDSDLSSDGSDITLYKTPKKPVPLSDSDSEHDDVDDTRDDITDEIDTDTNGQSTYSLEDKTSVTTDKENEVENASDANSNISNDSNDNDTCDDDDDGDGASPAQSDKSGDESGVTTDDDNDDDGDGASPAQSDKSGDESGVTTDDDDDDDDDDTEDGRPEMIPDLVNVNQHLFGKVTSFVYWMVMRAYGDPTVPEQDANTMKCVSSLLKKISSYMDACVSAAWSNGIKEALDSCPEREMTERGEFLGIDDLTDCQVCNRTNHPWQYRVTLNGVSYDGETLQEQDTEAEEYEYVMGQYCYRRVKFYHQLKHLEYSLYKECKRKLAKRQYMNPDKLAMDEAFQKKHYNKIVKLFHKVDYEIMVDADTNNYGTRFQRNFFNTSKKN